MNEYSIQTLAGWLGTEAMLTLPGTTTIHEILYDSRRINNPTASLFIALVTSRNNGHRYIPNLIRQGVCNFLVQEKPEEEFRSEANFILVPDTRIALQKLAELHRKQFELPVLAITGSNGKTIVKEWLYESLKDEFQVVRSPKSFNSQIGVPLSVWQISKTDQLGIIEAGISAPSEMVSLQEIIQPTLGIFTNIGHAHAENFSSVQVHIQEKMKLFSQVKTLVCCADHSLIVEEARNQKINCLTWGKNPIADLRIVEEQIKGTSKQIQLVWKNTEFTLSLPFVDAASVENALHTALMLLYLGISIEKIKAKISHLHPVEMRLEFRKGMHQCTLINDTWSADLDSLRIALEAMEQQQQHQKRTLILSDILESGKSLEELYSNVAQLVSRKGVSRFIGVGEQMHQFAPLFSGEKLFFPSTESLLAQLGSIGFQNECILLKGARIFGFERIASALQQKTHETVLEIKLSAMVNNLNFFRSKLSPGVKTMAMVKAFSYGSGSFEVANVLQFNGVDYLAVAYADEGIELRNAGISLPILVLSPEVDSFISMIENRLEPEIYSFRMLELFSQAVLARNGFDGQPIKIHIKFDTGMHRLGFEEADIPELIRRLNEIPQLSTAAAFTHLAASGETQHEAFTQDQIRRFTRFTDVLQKGLGKPFLRHVLNSSGISHYPHAQFDMVRLGIGLYGIGDEAEQQHLEAVSKLSTSISQIREVKAGESVGYSRKGQVNQPSRIATLPIGYADGFLRRLGNGRASVRVHGKQAFTIGNICMDMCMIDITHIPEAQEGDSVIIFEHAADIHQLAQWLETIPYEVLTGVSERVKRVYFQD
jgi:alanine racemase